MKRLIYMMLCMIAFLLLACVPITAQAATTGLSIKGQSCILLDGSNGRVLYAQDADKKCYPASTTKLMTLVIALEAVSAGKASLDDMVTTSEYAASMGGSQVYLYAGETRTLHEMLLGIAVGSGNDASVAVGEFLAGSNEAFVEKMNQKAQELGMTNTHFTNAHGLHDPDHYVSAADMGKLAYYALHVPKLLEYTSVYEYDFRPEPKLLKLWNTNRLLKWYDGTDGLKTGSTTEAGHNLIATAKRDNRRFISVVLGAEGAHGHFTESMKLLNYAFNSYNYETYGLKGQIITQLPVVRGVVGQAELALKEDLGYMQKKGEALNPQSSWELPKALEAPLTAGQEVGHCILSVDGEEIARIPLVVVKEIAKSTWLDIWQKTFCTAVLGADLSLS